MVEAYGIHPEQADQYMAARLEAMRFGGKGPNPEDFKRPVVLPFQPKQP